MGGMGFGHWRQKCHRFCYCAGMRGSNVVLHDRNARKLNNCGERLQKEPNGREHRLFNADVTRGDDKAVEDSEERVRDVDLTVLANNVGGTKGSPDCDFKILSSHNPAEIRDLMTANMQISTTLMAALLPTLVAHEPALFLITGSTFAGGMPYISVYAATKAYIRS